MSYTTPDYGIVVPSPSTRLNKLGSELQQMGISIEEVLNSFDYNGADPTLVLSRVASLEAAGPGIAAQLAKRAYYSGTAAEREALTPAPPGALWQTTDNNEGLYSASPTGTWRLHEGIATAAGGSWAIGGSSGPLTMYARTVVITIPTILSANETVMVSHMENSSGYTFVSLASVVRNTTNTAITLRHMIFGSVNQLALTVSWRIVKRVA